MENLKEYNQLVMNKKELKKLSKSQLINLLMKLENKKPEVIIVDDTSASTKEFHNSSSSPIQK